jgi:hypothetical protein
MRIMQQLQAAVLVSAEVRAICGIDSPALKEDLLLESRSQYGLRPDCRSVFTDKPS